MNSCWKHTLHINLHILLMIFFKASLKIHKSRKTNKYSKRYTQYKFKCWKYLVATSYCIYIWSNSDLQVNPWLKGHVSPMRMWIMSERERILQSIMPRHAMSNHITIHVTNLMQTLKMNAITMRYPWMNEMVTTHHVRHIFMPVNQTINGI